MKQWMVLCGIVGMVGALHASQNPFELKPSLQHIEQDIDDLIDDLKQVKMDDNALTQSHIESGTAQTEQELQPEKRSFDKAPASVSSEEVTKNKEKPVKDDISGGADTNLSKKMSVKKERTEKIEKTPVNDEIVQLDTLNKQASSSVVKAETDDMLSSSDKTKGEHIIASVSPSGAEQMAEKERKEALEALEKARREEQKVSKETDEKEVTIASLIEKGEGIANIDLKKEYDEEAKRAEEELRNAIAAVDQED